MQFGHLGIALAIASLDPRPETFLVVGAAQFLPNADSLIIRAGWARPDFHGTWSHSLLFCGAVGALAVGLFGPWLGGLAVASVVAHVLADLPTDTGLPLLLPFSRRRFSLNLWKNTGYWGRAMYVGYYRQPWAWILEGAVFAVVAWRYTGLLARSSSRSSRSRCSCTDPCRRSCRRRSRRPCCITRASIRRGCSRWWARSARRWRKASTTGWWIGQRGSRTWRGLRTGPGCAGASRPFSAPRSGPLRS